MGASEVWSPTLTFFRRRAAVVPHSDFHSGFNLSWRLETDRAQLPGATFVLCKMTDGQHQTVGCGFDFVPRKAVIKAFAEAWERLWLEIMPTGPSAGFPSLANSNGFAAGQSDDDACRRSRSELIERAVMLEGWRSMKGWSPYHPTRLWHRILLRSGAASGWRFRFFSLDAESLGIVLAVLGEHPKLGAIFDTCHAESQLTIPLAERSLTFSALRMRAAAETETDSPQEGLPECAEPLHHQAFYARPEHLVAFSFLPQHPRQHMPTIAAPSDVIPKIHLPKPENLKTILLHQTSDLPAVAYSFHEEWPQLCWGQRSIQGRNPWPHPLA